MRRFDVGAVVKGCFPDGEWYLATVEEEHGDGTYTVTWFDGDESNRRKRWDELKPMRFDRDLQSYEEDTTQPPPLEEEAEKTVQPGPDRPPPVNPAEPRSPGLSPNWEPEEEERPRQAQDAVDGRIRPPEPEKDVGKAAGHLQPAEEKLGEVVDPCEKAPIAPCTEPAKVEDAKVEPETVLGAEKDQVPLAEPAEAKTEGVVACEAAPAADRSSSGEAARAADDAPQADAPCEAAPVEPSSQDEAAQAVAPCEAAPVEPGRGDEVTPVAASREAPQHAEVAVGAEADGAAPREVAVVEEVAHQGEAPQATAPCEAPQRPELAGAEVDGIAPRDVAVEGLGQQASPQTAAPAEPADAGEGGERAPLPPLTEAEAAALLREEAEEEARWWEEARREEALWQQAERRRSAQEERARQLAEELARWQQEASREERQWQEAVRQGVAGAMPQAAPRAPR